MAPYPPCSYAYEIYNITSSSKETCLRWGSGRVMMSPILKCVLEAKLYTVRPTMEPEASVRVQALFRRWGERGEGRREGRREEGREGGKEGEREGGRERREGKREEGREGEK